MRHRSSTSLGRWALATATGLVLLVGCSSSPSDGGGGRSGDIGTARRPAAAAANEDYLLELGYQPDQATCVSDAVTVDLRELLSGTDGADPTERPGYDQFAAATKRCIQADSALTTTTAPTG